MMQKKDKKKRKKNRIISARNYNLSLPKNIYEFLILLTSTNGYTQESNH